MEEGRRLSKVSKLDKHHVGCINLVYEDFTVGSGEKSSNKKTAVAEPDLNAFYIKEME